MRHLLPMAALAALFLTSAPAGAAVVVNGGFQTGDFTGWTPVSDDSSSARVEGPADFRAAFFGSGVSSLTQTAATLVGQRYRLTFDAALDFPFAVSTAAPMPGEIRMLVTIDGAELEVFNAGEEFAGYTLDFTGSGSSTLLFQVGAGFGRWQLDNVAIAPADVAAVPEPATWGMMLLGFGLAGTSMRRRRCAVTYA